jgi:hypothetical protein
MRGSFKIAGVVVVAALPLSVALADPFSHQRSDLAYCIVITHRVLDRPPEEWISASSHECRAEQLNLFRACRSYGLEWHYCLTMTARETNRAFGF